MAKKRGKKRFKAKSKPISDIFNLKIKKKTVDKIEKKQALLSKENELNLREQKLVKLKEMLRKEREENRNITKAIQKSEALWRKDLNNYKGQIRSLISKRNTIKSEFNKYSDLLKEAKKDREEILDRNAYLKSKIKEFLKKRAQVENREDKVKALEIEFSEREDSLNKREKSILDKESAFVEKERGINEKLKLLSDKKSDLIDAFSNLNTKAETMSTEWKLNVESFDELKDELMDSKSELNGFINRAKGEARNLLSKEEEIRKYVDKIESVKEENALLLEKKEKEINKAVAKLETGMKAKDLNARLRELKKVYLKMKADMKKINEEALVKREMFKGKESELLRWENNLRQRENVLSIRAQEFKKRHIPPRKKSLIPAFLRKDVNLEPEINVLVHKIKSMIAEGRIHEAKKAILELQKMVSKASSIDEKKKLKYEILELRTDIKLAGLGH